MRDEGARGRGGRGGGRGGPRPRCASVRLVNPPSSVVINTQGRESGGFWFETCSGVRYPRRCSCGVAINTLVGLIDWLGKPQVFFVKSSRPEPALGWTLE